MDDQTLAEQLAKTGDMMDLARDKNWVRESAQIETECGGRIEAGLDMKAYAQAKYDDSLAPVRQALRRQMRIQSILFVELERWMMEWDIGIAFEATYTEARERVRTHLKQPAPELAAWAEAVLIEADSTPPLSAQPARAQTRAQLLAMMTDEDWETLAQIAASAASASVLSVAKAEQPVSVAA